MYTMNPTAAIASPATKQTAWTSKDFDALVFESTPTVPFRLLDDDREIYFEGRMTKERLDGYEWECFAPLNRTEAAYGCTELQYFESGTWNTL